MQKISDATTYLFDLDDTLYCPTLGILKQVESRMHQYIATALSLPLDEATVLSNHYYQKYGGTVKGLVKHHSVDRDDFIHFCHDVNLQNLLPQQKLISQIDNLHGRKIIYTNSPKHYATRILDKLSLSSSFDDVFSLEDASYNLKPAPKSYDTLCKIQDIDAHNAVFFDDQLRNLQPAKTLGMTTVWVSGSEQIVSNPEFTSDFKTDNLTQFFDRLTKQ